MVAPAIDLGNRRPAHPDDGSAVDHPHDRRHLPVIDIPVVLMVWNYPGLTTEDMERRVVFISERAYSTTVNGIERIVHVSDIADVSDAANSERKLQAKVALTSGQLDPRTARFTLSWKSTTPAAFWCPAASPVSRCKCRWTATRKSRRGIVDPRHRHVHRRCWR
jgi:hypothetical protein